jgi:hypothetical protein
MHLYSLVEVAYSEAVTNAENEKNQKYILVFISLLFYALASSSFIFFIHRKVSSQFSQNFRLKKINF